MDTPKLTVAQQLAQVASIFQEQRTGDVPGAVTTVLSEGTPATTLHGTLNEKERI